MVKMTTILEKSVLASRYHSSPTWPILQPVTALISTAGEPASGGPKTTFTVNHKPQSNLYEKFKGFVEVTLYNINKWGCTLC